MDKLSPALTIALLALVSAFLIWTQSKKKGRSAKSDGGSGSILKQHTRDLTQDAIDGNLDPVIGRENEIERVVHILSRRRKNNPLLLGEPGVGKTAIVEGLARRIHKGYIPDSLKGKRVLSLDLTGIISGTKYRGEFEQRMHKLTEEIESMGRKIILFIDEIHMIEQASGAEGAMNVSDILKPALARGDLQAVGATTLKEYTQYIKTDDALNRRFQPVFVGEPSDEESFEILRGIKEVYETFHHVQIPDKTLQIAIELSKQIEGRFLPDKALDLIDEAGAKVSIEAKFAHVDASDDPAEIQKSKDHITKESKRLREVIADLEELDEEFPDELEIEKAHRALTRHLEQLTTHDKIIRDTKGLIVTEKDIQEIVEQWKTQANIT